MLIVVPDDNPPALAGTPALERLHKIDEVRVYDSDATDPAVLIERLKEAGVAVNIRGRTRFTDQVLQACPKLKLISIWGTGTDNVELRRRRPEASPSRTRRERTPSRWPSTPSR
jgi:phosphoglycerate dehydrogenase-like enzyme